MSWHHDKTIRPWYAAGKMVVRKQLSMNTLISLLLSSIATQLDRFIAGRLLSRPSSSKVAFLVHQRMRKIQTQILFSPAAWVCSITQRRPNSMRVSIALVFETDSCFIRRSLLLATISYDLTCGCFFDHSVDPAACRVLCTHWHYRRLGIVHGISKGIFNWSKTGLSK